jgi:hypothetical protein
LAICTKISCFLDKSTPTVWGVDLKFRNPQTLVFQGFTGFRILEYKPDFKQVKERWETFWKGDSIGRPLVSIELPKEGVIPIEKPAYMAGAEGDFEPVIQQLLGWVETHEFLGEAIPSFRVEFGPEQLATFLGVDDLRFDYKHNTSWGKPFIEDFEKIDIKFNRDCYWWERTVNFIRTLRKRCDGKLLIAMPTLSGGLDALATMRGSQKLLMDLVLNPDEVKSALAAINQAYGEVIKDLAEELGCKEYGSINRHGMYSKGLINVPQCDISCMISNDMFEEFVVPSIKYEAGCLDSVEYHLDGPDALKHLSSLCELDCIDVIQWVEGAGEAENKDWNPLIKKIDSYGKGQILWRTPDQIKILSKELKSNKLFFCTRTKTKYEAEKFIESLES